MSNSISFKNLFSQSSKDFNKKVQNIFFGYFLAKILIFIFFDFLHFAIQSF